MKGKILKQKLSTIYSRGFKLFFSSDNDPFRIIQNNLLLQCKSLSQDLKTSITESMGLRQFQFPSQDQVQVRLGRE